MRLGLRKRGEECIPTGENECGGTEPLDDLLGDPCKDGQGVWECDGEDALECIISPVVELRPATDGCQHTEAECSLSVTVGEQLPLTVQTLSDDEPLESQSIDFDLNLVSGAEGAELISPDTLTDNEGFASVVLHSGAPETGPDTLGQVEVVATTEEVDAPPRVTFHISIEAAETGSYDLDFTHQGDASFDRIRTATFPDGVTCDTILSDYFDHGEWVDELQEYPPVGLTSAGQFPSVEISDLAPGDGLAIAAIAEKEVDSSDVHYGFGCVDSTPDVEVGESVPVEMPLFDHLPHFQDHYEMTREFVLGDTVPPAVSDIIHVWMHFGEDPAKFFFGCPDDQGHCDETQGLFDLLLQSDIDFDSAIVDAIEDLRSSGQAWAITADTLHGMTEMAEQDGVIHPWATDANAIEQHFLTVLESFRATGHFSFGEQAELKLLDDRSMGRFDAADHRWEEVFFRWGEDAECDSVPDDPNCEFVPVSLDGAGMPDATISGEFSATVTNQSSIAIDPHPVEADLKYAEFLFATIDQIAPPHMTDDDDASDLTDIFDEVFDCPTLHDELTAGPLPEPLADATYELCLELSESTSEILYQYVQDEGDDDLIFNLHTPDDNPCELQLLESYSTYSAPWPGHPFPLLVGFSAPNDWCIWEAEIDNNNAYTVTGDFHGEASP